MSRVTCWFLACLRISPFWLCVQGGSAFAADATPAPNTLTVRAGHPLNDDLLKKFAALVVARTLPRESYPDLPLLTPRQVISVLCGSFRQTYWEEVLSRNAEALKGKSADTVLGEGANSIRWPGCPLVVVHPPIKYVVKLNDTASSVYKKFTGVTGSSQTLRSFFQGSGVDDLSKLKPGQTLAPAHVTIATPVLSALSAPKFASQFSAPISPDASGKICSMSMCAVDLSADATATAAAQNPDPKFDIAAGRIQSAATDDAYESPKECSEVAASGPLFDALRLTYSYKDALEAVSLLHLDNAAAKVTIADNGFFGANLHSGQLAFGPQFPSRFFATSATAGEGQIGPIYRTSTPPVYPISYLNQLPKATYISGHGTHVTGLAIGGVGFQPYLSMFDREPDKPWLHLWIINVGNGKEVLLPNSAIELSTQINLLVDAIVNLSIQYSTPTDVTDANLLRLMNSPSDLFVVSAGNNGKSDVRDGPFYPAMLGGVGQRNVISVAAHRPDGTLARFSNRGRLNVDLAAPGCDVQSWLDDSAEVSKISGTSQAAAIVTFASALLKSLGDLSPLEIKNRLIISGDPLRRTVVAKGSPADDASIPLPSQVYSRARLNVVRALYLFDDYLSYRDGDGNLHEALGIIQGITGLRCPDSVQWQNVWALKTSDDGLLMYGGKRSPQEIVQSPCEATATPDAAIQIRVRAFLGADGKPQMAALGTVVRIPLSKLDEFVSASKPYRKQL